MPNLWPDLSKQLKENNKLSVVAVLILSDFICICLSAITAFQFRFPQDSPDADSKPAIAQLAGYSYFYSQVYTDLSTPIYLY